MPYDNMHVFTVRTTSGTKIPVFCLKYPGAKFTLLFSHGNATDIGAMYPMFVMLARTLKINVVGYDYTGYGSSMDDGIRPTEKQVYKDIDAVYDWCVSSGLVGNVGKELLVYGQSVGSGPTTYIASTRPVAGVVLHSALKSGLRVVTASRLLCCCDIFPNIDRIRNIQAPAFIIHGEVRTSIALACLGFHVVITLWSVVGRLCATCSHLFSFFNTVRRTGKLTLVIVKGCTKLVRE